MMVCRSFLILIIFLSMIPAYAAGVRQKLINKQRYCNLYDLMTGNKYRTVLQKKQTIATGKKFVCIFGRNQRRMSVNNVKVELLNPLVFEGNVPWVSNLDWYKTMRPVLYPATVSRRRVTTIMIDMGHGGNDPGAIGAFSKEKMITLRVGLRVAQILRAYGFRVVMTRTKDVQIPLAAIGPMQQRSKSDLFVSIHVNATINRKVSGIETYCLTPAGAASSNGGKASDKIHPGNRQDDGNMLLAWNIQTALLRRTKAVDRGVKRARFAVLRDINAPGVLIEIGFITNAAEEKKLNDREYVDKIAYGIVDGIIGYTRSTLPVKK